MANKIYPMARTFPRLLCRHCVESLGTSKHDQIPLCMGLGTDLLSYIKVLLPGAD